MVGSPRSVGALYELQGPIWDPYMFNGHNRRLPGRDRLPKGTFGATLARCVWVCVGMCVGDRLGCDLPVLDVYAA